MNVVALAAVAWLALADCSGTSKANDSGNGHSCAQYTLCTQDGSAWTCDCGGPTVQACPASAMQAQPCDGTITGGCMGCYWSCSGGGNACR